MCFFMSLIPATMIVVVGYFVLFSSTRAEGGIRRFAHVLAIWLFAVALLPPVGGAYITLGDLCPIEAALEAFG